MKIIYDRETRRSKGFAFITFAEMMSAAAAADGTNLREIDGRQVRCNLVGRCNFKRRSPC